MENYNDFKIYSKEKFEGFSSEIKNDIKNYYEFMKSKELDYFEIQEPMWQILRIFLKLADAKTKYSNEEYKSILKYSCDTAREEYEKMSEDEKKIYMRNFKKMPYSAVPISGLDLDEKYYEITKKNLPENISYELAYVLNYILNPEK